MTLEIDGLRAGAAGGVDMSQATQPLVSCRRCLDAMLGFGSSVIRQRWRFWLASAVAGNIPNGAEGCTYVMRVRRDDDAEVT
jgi:hypothetical protein